MSSIVWDVGRENRSCIAIAVALVPDYIVVSSRSEKVDALGYAAVWSGSFAVWDKTSVGDVKPGVTSWALASPPI